MTGGSDGGVELRSAAAVVVVPPPAAAKVFPAIVPAVVGLNTPLAEALAADSIEPLPGTPVSGEVAVAIVKPVDVALDVALPTAIPIVAGVAVAVAVAVLVGDVPATLSMSRIV